MPTSKFWDALIQMQLALERLSNMNSDTCSAPVDNFSHEIDVVKFPQVHTEALQETRLCFCAKYCAYSHFSWLPGCLEFEETEIHKT